MNKNNSLPYLIEKVAELHQAPKNQKILARWLSVEDNLKTDTSVTEGVFYNDEVNCQVISPDTYRDLIFPCEQELARFQNGITYWHSCGNTSPALKYIKQLEGLEMYDSSAWSKLDTTIAELKGTEIPLEIRMNPLSDVYYADKETTTARLKEIIKKCQGLPITVRADGMQFMNNLTENIKKIKDWGSVARDCLHN